MIKWDTWIEVFEGNISAETLNLFQADLFFTCMEYVAYIRWGQGWDTGFQFVFKYSLLVQTLLEKATLTCREIFVFHK